MHNGLDHVDPALNLTREDYRHLAAPKSGDASSLTIEQAAPPIPKIADILAAPRPPKIGETQLVSIAVTDDVPLKDVLLELAKLADVDIELDAGISGGISFIAKDKPFNEVIDRIADLANLRYSMKNGVLRVERDSPFIKSYSLDFLNLDRDSDSSVSLTTNVLSSSVSSGGGSGGGGGSGLSTGSTSSVKSKASGDFWKSLEGGVQQILAYEPAMRVSETTMQAEADANVVAGMTGQPPAAGAPAGAPGAPAPAPAPAPKAAPAPSGGGALDPKKSYTINRQAGVLTLNGSERQHAMVSRLLEVLRQNASAQVLIEGKIIEVTLDEEYASGINWSIIGSRLIQRLGLGSVSEIFPMTSPVGTATQGITFTSDSNASNLVSLIEQFGSARTLSSPRLHAINNQQSTMTFAQNQVYFTLTITPPTTTTTGTVSTTPTSPTVTSNLQTVPIGIMMTMMPSIDLEHNEITLAVRPTLSTVVGQVQDPAAAIAAAEVNLSNLVSTVPIVQVRELDSTLKLKSGQTMVIGGLMEQGATNNDNGVPFVSGIPIIGNAFKNVSKSSKNKELVLLIKATIVNSNGSMGGIDKTIMKKFTDDPRPVSF